MKKSLLAVALLLLPTTSFAAGPFDGIYTMNINGLIGYASVHENNNSMIIVTLEPSPNDSTWEALSGVRNGNSATLNSILGTVNLEVSIVFIDNFNGNATIISCIGDDDDCDFPNGTVINMNKIF